MSESFGGLMTAQGFAADYPARWAQVRKDWVGKRCTVTIDTERSTRSHRQNAWYWACVVPAVGDHLSQGRTLPLSADQTHEVLKAAFIGVVTTELGSCPKSSAALTVQEFSDYCERIRAHAASEWGLGIPGPGEA